LYVPKEGLELGEALRLIKEAGAIAVLAHPMSLYVSWGRLPGLVKDLAEQGLDGIEAWHPTAKVRSCKRLEELAIHLGLFVTAGSDFHGESRPDRKLGITAGGRKIEETVLAAIPPLGANFFPQALADRR
jgi:predicted metal-dependent phosphoesterase TrpH